MLWFGRSTIYRDITYDFVKTNAEAAIDQEGIGALPRWWYWYHLRKGGLICRKTGKRARASQGFSNNKGVALKLLKTVTEKPKPHRRSHDL